MKAIYEKRNLIRVLQLKIDWRFWVFRGILGDFRFDILRDKLTGFLRGFCLNIGAFTDKVIFFKSLMKEKLHKE